jgi:2-methylcitrate dehydratase PrpD
VNVEQVSTFVTELKWEQVPEQARQRARQRLLDTIGTAVGGWSTNAGAVAVASTAGERGEYLALAPGLPRLPAASAGFVSSVHASALDYDDGHYQGGAIHPSSVIVPALLVAGSRIDVGGEQLAVAQVAAYEVAIRLAHLLWPRTGDRWHCTATAGAVGAAAGVARLLGLDAERTRSAILTAWSHSPQSALHLPMSKEAIGWGGAVAVHAASLAATGWMAVGSGLEAPPTPSIFPPTPFDYPDAQGDPFVRTIGSVFEIERSYLKPHAACRYTHTAVDVLGELLDAGVSAAQITDVRVLTHSWASFLDYRRPVSLEHAQYSYPFVLAVRAIRGAVTPRELNEAALTDPDLLEFAGKVSVVEDPSLDDHLPDHYPTALEIVLESGEVMAMAPRVIARGDAEAPLDDAAIEAKFRGMAEPVLGGRAEDVISAVAGYASTRELWAGLGAAGV